MVALPRHDHDLRWMAPHPLWSGGGAGLNGAPTRPAILRFATDAFMDELMALTATRPEALPAWLAVPETWREPAPPPPAEELRRAEPLTFARARRTEFARAAGMIGGAAAAPSPAASGPLKLYQPAQDRFYLVAAQLVCARPGLPDRRIEAGKEERARFVIRRLRAADGGPVTDPEAAGVTEYAFVPRGQGGWWKPLTAARKRLDPEEERLGLFPVGYALKGRRRRLLLGALPVAKREAYVAAPLGEGGAPPPAADPAGPSPLAILFRTEVVAPWGALLDKAEAIGDAILENASEGSDGIAPAAAMLGAFRAQAQGASWLILADLRRFLRERLPNVWAALETPALVPDTQAERDLLDALNAFAFPETLADDLAEDPDFEAHYDAADVERTLAGALLRMTDAEAQALETAAVEFDPEAGGFDPAGWPGFLWLAAHPGVQVDVDGEAITSPAAWAVHDLSAVEALEDLVEAALAAAPPPADRPVPDLAPPAETDRSVEDWYAVRCVLERPNCVGFAEPVVSDVSVPFRMASFFDPDAPARTIRIPMPLDISAAGLRKYKKAAGFVVSDMFCGQMNRFAKVTFGDLIRSVLPWPLHKDLPKPNAAPCESGSPSSAFGLFISISIPIVTICAFILMMIMVALLDIVFRWLPYLLVVFPIARLRGKT